MKSLYLIQRGSIKRPLPGQFDAVRLSQAVSLDYMGSSEFEWGALPESFRRIEAHPMTFIMRVIDSITDTKDGVVRPLKVWSCLQDDEFAAYAVELTKLRDNQIRTKEYTSFQKDRQLSSYDKTDFWWDIQNDTMFGFDLDFMGLVGDCVANSLAYMNEQKEKA
jgi:hypothetical protein